MAEEHTKGKRPSKREQHQKGAGRKGRDAPGGEKGDERRPHLGANKRHDKTQGKGKGKGKEKGRGRS